jgi:hypothetical protein
MAQPILTSEHHRCQPTRRIWISRAVPSPSRSLGPDRRAPEDMQPGRPQRLKRNRRGHESKIPSVTKIRGTEGVGP